MENDTMSDEEMIEKIKKLMYKPDNIRNIGTIAHIDHGKTTFSDSLIADAGMISFNIAGQRRFLDTDDQEQERGITIWSANASMVHSLEGEDYLINLIDTPGHVDFGGDVTRALRAVDGAILLVDAVEAVMPQTETVLRQAMKDRVKPVLFINKVDRLLKELRLTPEQMQERFMKIITEVNILIQKYAEPEYKKKFLVNVSDGSVVFGSALKKWGTSIPYMKKTGISFKEIIDATAEGKEEELSKKAPLHTVVLDMIIKHLPSPNEAQKYRLEKLWQGDVDSEVGKSMVLVDPNGKLSAVVTKVSPDQHAGFIATSRVFSGKITKGEDIYLVGKQKSQRVQQVNIYKGPHRVQVDEVVAGNICGIVGISDAFSGETLCSPDHIIQPFEEIKHIFEPVVTKSVEPKNPRDLAKLINFLKKLSREDTTIKVKINQETGEYLISGLGELHLEAKVERKFKEMDLDVIMSPPIVVYRETVGKESPVVEGKSPNKHNVFEIMVEPLDKPVYEAMVKGDLESDYKPKGKKSTFAKEISEVGMDYDEAKRIVLIHGKNMLIDMTKGVQYMNEIMELIKEAFVNAMDEGTLCREPSTGIKVKLLDASLHEDPVHRGPGQIIPAFRASIRNAVLRADSTLLEPKQLIRIDAPEELMGAVSREVENRRGQIINIETSRGYTVVTTKIPVSAIFGLDASLKSATSGRGFYSVIEVVFEKLPAALRDQTIISVRKRKGLSESVPTARSED